MTRAEQVAAAIERLNLMESDWRETRLWEVAVELARLLRELQPEPGAEKRCLYCGNVHDMTHPTLACPPSQPEPAPVVGDDKRCPKCYGRGGAHDPEAVDQWYECGYCGGTGENLADRLTAALADVARLTEERDSSDAICKKQAFIITGLRAALAAAEQEKEKAVAEERAKRGVPHGEE